MDKILLRNGVVPLALLVALIGCGNNKTTLTKAAPRLATITPSSAGYFDTVVVEGSGFNPIPAENRVVISQSRFSDPVARRVMIPLSGSSSELRGLIPDGSFAGSVRVEDAAPLADAFSFGIQPPPGASNTLPFAASLSSGDVGKAFFSGMNYGFTISAGASSEDYVVVLFSDAVAPNNTWTYTYSISAQSTSPLVENKAPTARSGGRSRSSAAADALRAEAWGSMGTRERDFEKRLGDELETILRGGASGELRVDRGRGTFRSSIPGEGAAPQTAHFHVLVNPDSSSVSPSNFTTVEAELEFTGAHTLLYVDTRVLNECPTCLTQADADSLGQAFDSHIYETDRETFGYESDINHDGKVAILMSPVVNEMTPPGGAPTGGFIAGYFLANDLLPGLLDSRVTNGMEIFYTVVPDPTGLFGNSFPKDKVIPVIKGVLAHEFLHMILFNYRVLIYGRGLYADYMEKLWLNEGLAHIAENVNGYNSSNVARANLYLDHPGHVTLIYGGDDLDERGASYLFLRYLGDRYGDTIFKRLVQSKRTGTSNVEGAASAFFKELFADWDAACYLSGRGITSDTRFNYSSINLQGDYKPLAVTAGNVGGTPVAGYVKSVAPQFLSFTIPGGGAADFTIAGEATGKLNAVVIRTR